VVAEIADGPVRSIGIVTRRAAPVSPMSTKALGHVRASAKRLIEQAPAWLMPAVTELVT